MIYPPPAYGSCYNNASQLDGHSATEDTKLSSNCDLNTTQRLPVSYSISGLLCLFLVCVLTYDLVLADLSLIGGIQIIKWVFPLALLLAGLTVWLIVPNIRTFVAVAGIGVGLILVSLLVAALTIDWSCGGNVYHQGAIVRLLNGWNPYRISELQTKNEFLQCRLWENVYARGIETVQATIVAITHKVETGKAVNLIAVFAVLSGVLSFLTQQGYKLFPTIVLAIVAVGCPVVILQSDSFLIDQYKYIYVVLGLLGVWSIASGHRKSDWLLLGCVIILAVSTKFTTAFDIVLLLIVALVWFLWKKDYILAKKLFFFSIAVGLFSLLLNYSPYITNTVIAGHPLWPLMGDDTIDIMTRLTPEYCSGNRFHDFVASVLYRPAAIDGSSSGGGFGIFMVPILLLSLLAFVLKFRKIPAVYRYIAAAVFLSCFIFAQTWWPRYIAQLWLFPLIVVIVLWRNPLAKCVVVLMILNMFYCGFNLVRTQHHYAQYRQTLVEAAKTEPVRVFNFKAAGLRHLDEEQIDYTIVDSIPAGTRGLALFNIAPAEHRSVIILSDRQFAQVEAAMRSHYDIGPLTVVRP